MLLWVLIEVIDLDDNLLGDGNDDGYLLFQGLPTSNVTARRNLGLIELADVARGKPITLSFAFFNAGGGFNNRARLLVDSSVVNEVRFSTFGGGDQIGVINLMYTVALADIGRNLYFGIEYYAGGSGGRNMGIDQLTVVVPEPGTAMLLALSLLAVGGGRKRREA